MYKILTKASITKLLVFTGMQVSVASSSTCPSQLAPIYQTFNICTKLVNVQVGCIKPGVHTNDFTPMYGRRAKELGHASLATVFRHGRLTFQPIPRENLESPVIRSQPITTSVITDACLNTRWHHGAYISPKEDTGWLA